MARKFIKDDCCTLSFFSPLEMSLIRMEITFYIDMIYSLKLIGNGPQFQSPTIKKGDDNTKIIEKIKEHFRK
jgi:hypothetical protein